MRQKNENDVVDFDKYNFSQDSKLNEELVEEFNVSKKQLYNALYLLFGSVAFSTLKEEDLKLIDDALFRVVKNNSLLVESHYIIESCKHSEKQTAEIVSAAISGMCK